MVKITLYIIIAVSVVSLILMLNNFVLRGLTPKPSIELSESVPSIIEEKQEVELSDKPLDSTPDSSAERPIRYPNLKLEATIIANMPSAYIRELDSGKADFYSVGDKVSSAIVVEIQRAKVLLSVEDNLYSLYLDSDASTGEPEDDSSAFKIVKKADVLNIVNDNSRLSTLAELTPYRNNEGEFGGYLIDGVKKTSPVYWAGIRNGDILKKVNGQKLLTPQKAVQVFKRVRKLKDIEIGLLRDTKNITKTYNIE